MSKSIAEFNKLTQIAYDKIQEANKKLQEANEKLIELNRMKTDFIAVSSHELRTPLVMVKGYNEMMLKGMMGTLTEKQTRGLEVTTRNIKKLSNIIDELIYIAEIDADKLYLHNSDFQLCNVINEICEEVKPYVIERNLQLTFECSINLRLYADENRINQALFNLIQNAIKFTPDGGSIHILAKYQSDNSVLIEIKDTGIGIEKTEFEHIFESFYEVGSHLHHKSGEFNYLAGGSALGLSICKGIVEKHKGKIWVESGGLAKGSTFFVELPNASIITIEPTIEIIAEMPTKTDNPPKGRILIVDDEPVIVDLLVSHLVDKNYICFKAYNGIEALKIVYKKQIDLILLDLMMPNKDGLSVLEELKNDKTTAHIPILILSAKRDTKDKARSLHLGAAKYFTKPLEIKLIMDEINKLIK